MRSCITPWLLLSGLPVLSALPFDGPGPQALSLNPYEGAPPPPSKQQGGAPNTRNGAQWLPGFPTQQARYLFSFGDSYTTTGFDTTGEKPSPANPFGNPPYPGATVAGGPNWVDVLIHNLSPNGTLSYDFAYSGATVNASLAPPYIPTVLSFIDQVNEFKSSVASHPSYASWNPFNSAFAIWFGINDVYETREEQVDFTTLYNEIVTNYFQQVEILYSYGARRIVVFTVPPIGRTTLLTVETPSEAPYINNAVANFNSILLQQATSFQQAHADVNLRTVDTASVFNPILDNPTANGAPDNTCFDSSGTACLWFNDFHPGLVIQTAVGHAAYGALQSEGFYS